MKKYCYFILLFSIISIGNIFGQRHAELQLTMLAPKTGDTIEVNYPTNIVGKLKNNGPDSIRITDTFALAVLMDNTPLIFVNGSITQPYKEYTGFTLAPGDTTYVGIFLTITTGPSAPMQFCLAFNNINVVDSLLDNIPGNNKSCANIYIKYVDVSVGQNTVEPGGITIYPNPANEQVNLRIASTVSADCTILVKDVMGKTVLQHSAEVSQGYNNIHLNTSALSPGIYVCTVRVGQEYYNHKIEISSH
ncbi:MAG: T9SS type A sorting domain-containing protein [Bacteroidetes bacterium]|nr:T9SS type A sorting domain-containing protein [Bacteroidota bacterium]